MDNHNNNGHKGMMWMMLICCLLPVVILLGGGAFFKSIGYGSVGIVLVLGFAIFHMRHMFGSHGNHKSKEGQIKNDNNSENHKGCCH